MATLSWSMTMQITDIAAIPISRSPIEAEGIDRINITLAPGDTDKIINLQPGATASLHLLSINASSSSQYGEHISFVASDGATDSTTPVVLDSPQVFSGGSLALFGVDVRQLKFTNSSMDKPANIQIIVARDATP